MNQDTILEQLLEEHDTVEDGRRKLHPVSFKRITGKTPRQARRALARNGTRPIKPEPRRRAALLTKAKKARPYAEFYGNGAGAS